LYHPAPALTAASALALSLQVGKNDCFGACAFPPIFRFESNLERIEQQQSPQRKKNQGIKKESSILSLLLIEFLEYFLCEYADFFQKEPQTEQAGQPNLT